MRKTTHWSVITCAPASALSRAASASAAHFLNFEMAHSVVSVGLPVGVDPTITHALGMGLERLELVLVESERYGAGETGARIFSARLVWQVASYSWQRRTWSSL